MKFDSIPEKRILPGYEARKVTERKYQWMIKLLEGKFDNINAQNRPTILDFQGLPPGSKEEDFLKWIKREIDVEPGIILEDGHTELSLEAYNVLNFAYQKGKDFLKSTLKYREEEISVGPASISSKKDVFDLLNGTVLVKGVKGLSRAVLYCTLAKATIIAYEAFKNDAQLLEKNAIAFEESLVAPPSEVYTSTNIPEAPFVLLREDEEKNKIFYVAEDSSLKGFLGSRGKDIDKLMLRFLTRPESNAESAFRDGIGSRITIEKEQALELLPILCDWFLNKKTNFLEIENMSFFPEEETKKIKNLLLGFLPENSFSISFSKPESTSMGTFEAFVIKGILNSPKESDKFFSLSQNARRFEIQLVSPYNRNERGKMQHDKFDVLKYVIARTRLNGACPEDVFGEFVKDASDKSGISEKTILRDLLEGKDPPIVRIKKKNSKRAGSLYIARVIYSRWDTFNWVDDSLISDIEFAKNKNKK